MEEQSTVLFSAREGLLKFMQGFVGSVCRIPIFSENKSGLVSLSADEIPAMLDCIWYLLNYCESTYLTLVSMIIWA